MRKFTILLLAAVMFQVSHAQARPKAQIDHSFFFIGGQVKEFEGKRLLVDQIYMKFVKEKSRAWLCGRVILPNYQHRGVILNQTQVFFGGKVARSGISPMSKRNIFAGSVKATTQRDTIRRSIDNLMKHKVPAICLRTRLKWSDRMEKVKPQVNFPEKVWIKVDCTASTQC